MISLRTVSSRPPEGRCGSATSQRRIDIAAAQPLAASYRQSSAAPRSDAAGAAARRVRSRGAEPKPGPPRDSGHSGRGRPGRRAPGRPLRRNEPDGRLRPRSLRGLSRAVQQKIDAAGLRYRVVNAGVSGETSAGALRRLDWLLRAAGGGARARDGRQRRPARPGPRRHAREHPGDPRRPRAASSRRRASCWPRWRRSPNYGEDYRRRFRALYPELAKASGATLLPFLLDGVAGDPRLNQPDGIHPTAEGQRRVAENVWKVLRPML